jgi:hypothetical protein
MNPIFIEALVIGFVSAVLFLAIDAFDRNVAAANLLKFLVLVIGGIAVLHKLGPTMLGIDCFRRGRQLLKASRTRIPRSDRRVLQQMQQ